jgi:hypothetical protein
MELQVEGIKAGFGEDDVEAFFNRLFTHYT